MPNHKSYVSEIRFQKKMHVVRLFDFFGITFYCLASLLHYSSLHICFYDIFLFTVKTPASIVSSLLLSDN
jgi:hypothetical protein